MFRGCLDVGSGLIFDIRPTQVRLISVCAHWRRLEVGFLQLRAEGLRYISCNGSGV